jgi:hypothetical protein
VQHNTLWFDAKLSTRNCGLAAPPLRTGEYGAIVSGPVPFRGRRDRGK